MRSKKIVMYFRIILIFLIIINFSYEFKNIINIYRYSYSYITLKIDGIGNK